MSVDFSKNEEEILAFWQKNKIFDKLRQKNKGRKRWSFLDGPITANNPMGVHHAWGRTYKDLYQRYKAMRGFDQRFQPGFDCQGLWVEVEVEKELGFKNKKDIEKYGIAKFVKKCKERVLKYSKIQTEQSIRLGQWMDWENSYYTMSDENNYAIWQFLKKCYEKGILYKGRDVVPWCPRCGTAISQHEILTEEYKEITHKTIFVKFKVLGQNDTYLLAWTTTPWTLPGNISLAVHPDFTYAKVQDKKGNVFILLKEKAGLVEGGKILEEFNGKRLEGVKYEGLFDEFSAVRNSLDSYQHSVVLWKDITKEEGTGIVHIATGCGQEDYRLGKDLGLPVINLSDDESKYREGFEDLTGKFVNSNTVRDWIFDNLKSKNCVFKIEDYTHRYPTCWRCKSELIFRLVDEWYISMKGLRKLLMQAAKKIKWIPSFGLERELDWLKNMQDWLISKKRYWGLSLPIYECKDCGNVTVIGSKEELKEKAVEGWEEFNGHSPHRPWIDYVKIRCPKCGKTISRIKDVGNPWLDAGIVPFSTMGYFSDKNYWKKWFPIDFICESFPGQFKNWFYSLLVMSVVLEDVPPTKRIFGYATVVDEKGEEMHKSKGNAIWFDEAVDKIGADVMRWMYAKQNPIYNMKFGFKVAQETKRKLLTLWNSFYFFKTYVSDEYLKLIQNLSLNPKHILDRWIISRLNNLIIKVTDDLDNYNAAGASSSIENFFIEDLSLWYIRRSRRRFQKPKNDEEKIDAATTLYFTLFNLAKIIAPIMPFSSEKMYLNLKGEDMLESIHLFDWPTADNNLIDFKLENDMKQVRQIVNLVLAERTKAGIRVRQPLNKLKIRREELRGRNDLIKLIKEEVNVKEIIFDSRMKEEIKLDTEITSELKKEGQIREIVRYVQAMRKEAGLKPKNEILIEYYGSNSLNNLLLENKNLILDEAKAKDLRLNSSLQGDFIKKRDVIIGRDRLWLAIKVI